MQDAPTQKNSRNVWLLAGSQALFGSGQAIIATVAALVGFTLADNKLLATLPVSVMFITVMVTAVPASLLMGRIGRRPGFLIGNGIAFAGSVLGYLSILQASFWLFTVASAFLGMSAAFAQLLRFAAAEAAAPGKEARAISLVLAGGVVAALIGPTLAAWSRDLLLPAVFAGTYVVMAALAVGGVAVMWFVDLPPPTAAVRAAAQRPLADIARTPAFIVAALSAMLGYGTMNLVMTATPLAMAGSHSFTDTALVIQWHVLGMFAPSFVTGSLIKRFGVLNVIAVGAGLAAAGVAANMAGGGFWNFWIGLVLVGLGWNFMFVGGTTLLTTVPSPAERPRTQALNDFLVWGTVATASLGSGAVFNLLGWQAVNLLTLPALAMVLAGNVWLRRQQRPVTAI